MYMYMYIYMHVEMIPYFEQKQQFQCFHHTMYVPLKLLLRNQTCNWKKKWMSPQGMTPSIVGFFCIFASEFPTKVAVRFLIRIHYAGTSSLSDFQSKEIYMYLSYCNFAAVISNSNWLSTKMALKMSYEFMSRSSRFLTLTIYGQ